MTHTRTYTPSTQHYAIHTYMDTSSYVMRCGGGSGFAGSYGVPSGQNFLDTRSGQVDSDKNPYLSNREQAVAATQYRDGVRARHHLYRTPGDSAANNRERLRFTYVGRMHTQRNTNTLLYRFLILPRVDPLLHTCGRSGRTACGTRSLASAPSRSRAAPGTSPGSIRFRSFVL